MTDNINHNKLNVECEWMKTKRLLVNPDGQVLPCCFFANVIYMYDKLGTTEKIAEKRNQISDQIGDKTRITNDTATTDVLMNYYNNREKYNIHNTPLEEIINSDWFTKTLPESWNDPNLLVRQCKKYCQKKNEE